MTGALESTQANLVNVPWAQDAETKAYLGVLGAQKDGLLTKARLGAKMRWPGGPLMQAAQAALPLQNEPVPSAAGDELRLRNLGAGFNLQRLGSMTDAQYEAYLESAWATWGAGGTMSAITAALNAYGIPDVEVVEEWQSPVGGWACPFGYGWRICVILGPNYGTLGWGPQTFPMSLPLPVLGIAGMTAAQLADLARLTRLWKIAATTPVKLVFRFKANGVTSPVFGAAGLTFPIPLSSAPEAVSFYMTGHYFNERADGAGNLEGISLPMKLGPTYLLDGTG